jgi:hypothetical protein
MTKAERDLLLLVANWLAMTIAHQACVHRERAPVLIEALRSVKRDPELAEARNGGPPA